MKIETMVLVGAAVGIGFLIARRKQAAVATIPPAAVPPQQQARALPEENAEVIFVQPAVEYVPYPAWGWGPGWGGGWGRGGGRHHHHRGGGRRGGRR